MQVKQLDPASFSDGKVFSMQLRYVGTTGVW